MVESVDRDVNDNNNNNNDDDRDAYSRPIIFCDDCFVRRRTTGKTAVPNVSCRRVRVMWQSALCGEYGRTAATKTSLTENTYYGRVDFRIDTPTSTRIFAFARLTNRPRRIKKLARPVNRTVRALRVPCTQYPTESVRRTVPKFRYVSIGTIGGVLPSGDVNF